ncbi:MAG: hypothetical protein IKK14_03330 [Oscillospiraceae bacterium]|nr:hypothetical protein [Oscillospiraceae bacterium]
MEKNKIKYSAIEPKRCYGNEEIISETGDKIATICDFWSWAYSDILGNTERGILAEYFVAKALKIDYKNRISWDKYDLLSDEGISIEVKSSGYFQSWGQKQKSKLIFGIQQTKAWDYLTDEFEEEKKRQADIYVFCVHNAEEKDEKINPLDLSQWDFYLLPTCVIDEKLGAQKTVSLVKLKKIGAEKCPYENLHKRIVELILGGQK